MEQNAQVQVSHTPGPWLWHDSYGDRWTKTDRQHGKDFDGLFSEQGETILCGWWHNDSTAGVGVSKEADARLIAEAPELLEALEAWLEFSAYELEPHESEADEGTVAEVRRLLAACRTAIEKARGG